MEKNVEDQIDQQANQSTNESEANHTEIHPKNEKNQLGHEKTLAQKLQ